MKILTVELKKQYQTMLSQVENKYFLWFINQLLKNSNQSIGQKYIPDWVSYCDIEHPKNITLDVIIKGIIQKGLIERSCDERSCEFKIASKYFNLNKPIKKVNYENIN